MRKPTTNKRVTRALAVGLAIMLAAMSTPTMITATEGEGNEVNINIPKAVTAEPVFKVLTVSAASVGTAKFASISKPVTLGAEENEAGLEQAIEDVGAAIIPDDAATPEVTGQVYDAVVSADSLAKETVPEFTVSSNHTLSDNTTTAIEDLKKNLEDNKDVTKNTLSANSYVEGAKDDLTTALTTTKNADDELTLSVNIAKNLGDTAVSAGNLNAQAVDQAGTNASNTIDNQESIINSAVTHEAVDNAVKVAKAAAKSAQDVYNEKLKDFNAKKATYDEALKEVEAKKAAFDKAVKDAAENKKGAQEKLEKAEKELKDAQDQLAKLEGEVKKAQDAVDTAEKDKKAALTTEYMTADGKVVTEYETLKSELTLSVNNAQTNYDVASLSANNAQDEYTRVYGQDVSGNHIKGDAEKKYDDDLAKLDNELKQKTDAIDNKYKMTLETAYSNYQAELGEVQEAKNYIKNVNSVTIVEDYLKKVYSIYYDGTNTSKINKTVENEEKIEGSWCIVFVNKIGWENATGSNIQPNSRPINVTFNYTYDKTTGMMKGELKTVASDENAGFLHSEFAYYDLAWQYNDVDIIPAEIRTKLNKTAAKTAYENQKKEYDGAKTSIDYNNKKTALQTTRKNAIDAARAALENANKNKEDAQGVLDNAVAYKERVIGKFDKDGKITVKGEATIAMEAERNRLKTAWENDTTAAGDEANYIRSEINVKFAPLYNQAAELKDIIAKAEKRVAELKDEIAKIKEVPENAADKFAAKKLSYLEKELKDAEAELKESGDKLAVLNDKIARIETAATNRNNWITAEAVKKQQEEWARIMASRAMTGIAQEASSDESHSSSSSSSSGSSSEPSYVVPATTATIAPVVPAFDLASAGAPVTRARTVTRRRGVAGVRNNNTNSDGDANAEALDAEVKEEVPAVVEDLTAMADNKANKAEDPGLVIGKDGNTDTKQFGDNEIPLSSGSIKKSPVSSVVVALCVGSVAIAGAGAAFVTASRRKKLALSESIKNLDK